MRTLGLGPGVKCCPGLKSHFSSKPSWFKTLPIVQRIGVKNRALNAHVTYPLYYHGYLIAGHVIWHGHCLKFWSSSKAPLKLLHLQPSEPIASESVLYWKRKCLWDHPMPRGSKVKLSDLSIMLNMKHSVARQTEMDFQ